MPRKILTGSPKYRADFRMGAGVIAVCYQPLIYVVLVSSYSKLYLVVLLSVSFRIVTLSPHPWRLKGSMLPTFLACIRFLR